jgi:hypothetical protein
MVLFESNITHENSGYRESYIQRYLEGRNKHLENMDISHSIVLQTNSFTQH